MVEEAPFVFVWVAEVGEYSGRAVMAVFSSLATARDAGYKEEDLSRFILDAPTKKTGDVYQVWLCKDGTLYQQREVERSKWAGEVLESWWARPGVPILITYNEQKHDYDQREEAVLVAEVLAKSVRHALKIVNERRAAILAAGLWGLDTGSGL